jgi:hypothetical protein
MAKDYRDRAIKKPVTLDGVEFLRRFTLHILPDDLLKSEGSAFITTRQNETLLYSLQPREARY